MKKIAFLVAIVATMFTCNLYAQKLVASDVVFSDNTTEQQVSFSLEGFESPLPAIAEFVITLPDGFSFKTGRRDYVIADGIAAYHSVTLNKRANGDYYVLLSDVSGYEFEAANGFLISLTMVKDAAVTDGQYTASIHDIVIDDVTGKIHLVAEKEASINITVGEVAAPAYFLVGNMNDWTASADYQLTRNEGAADIEEYMITLDLEAGAEFKVVKGAQEVWYPDGVENNCKVTEAGKYNIYFRPNGDGGDDWYYNVIYVEKNITDGIRGINANGTTGDVYNTAGQRVSRTTKGLYIQNGKKVVKK